MQLSGTTIPGYKVYEYLLVLSPHEALKEKIMQVKQQFYDEYKASSALYARPHVTLANFLQYGMKEERIISRLSKISMGYHPIKVELKDYGSFPTHTIYINVTSKLPIQGLVKTIRAETQ